MATVKLSAVEIPKVISFVEKTMDMKLDFVKSMVTGLSVTGQLTLVKEIDKDTHLTVQIELVP